MNSFTKRYVERVRELRKARKWSQFEMARRSDIALPTYRKFEYTGTISLDRFIRILRVLGREEDLMDLLTRPDLPRTPEEARKALNSRE